jgi:imidazolonepropionase-like amidohydrolase
VKLMSGFAARAAGLAALLAVSTLAAAQEEPLVLTNVTVIDVAAGQARPGMTVVMREGRIAQVGTASKASVPENARVVDARGKFLIPGLWDMHVHWWHTEQLTLALAHGVTGVRVMWGGPRHHERQKQTAAGTLLGPRQVIGSPIMDGPDPVWKGSVGVGTAEEARAAVRQAKEDGAEFIKVYSRLPLEAFLAIAEESGKLGIPFAGHIPSRIPAAVAVDAGQRSVEHMDYMLFATSSRQAELLNVPFASLPPADRNLMLHRAMQSYDAQKAAALFAHMRSKGTWQCPTLTAPRWRALRDDPVFTGDARLKYVRPWLRRSWAEAEPLREWTAESFARQKEIFAGTLRLAKAMHEAGVGLLAGTDIGNPYLYPGSSLHDEMQLFVQAGLSPADALRTATLNPARYLEREADFGTVAEGKIADLVLLDADPLQDIGNTRGIAAVIFNGRYFDRAQLDAMLTEVERMASTND